MCNRLDSIPACDGRTDRQTDKHCPRYAYASGGKNHFIYADDICLAIQGQYFSELECSLSSKWRECHTSVDSGDLSQAPREQCQFIWMASAFGMSATQPILG